MGTEHFAGVVERSTLDNSAFEAAKSPTWLALIDVLGRFRQWF
ncbi:hypothetical protein Pla52n_40540 [Stieleria varia]|uniref:Uncharacterized protein n=1 Tax=Stieleria varia TaxID=2528005 RepID=A0A5C6ASJ9_9BACT|nr:hypothetical protein Pla52n_40540 [Stieleria varia]